MGTVLRFRASTGKASRKAQESARACQIVIFPGVRIERHDAEPGLDLGHRLRDSAGRDTFDGIGGGRRPRKTS